MTLSQLFAGFWWLIFPIGGMLMGLYAMISDHRHRSDKLKLLKAYAEQGKDPPAFLLDALKDGGDDSGMRTSRRTHRSGSWGQVVTFAALAVGLGYYGYFGNHDNSALFMALALGFGIAAVVLLVLGIIGALNRPRLPRNPDRIDD